MGAEKIYNNFLSAAKAHMRLQKRAFLQERCVEPDIEPNCLQRLSADDTSTDDCEHKWALKKEIQCIMFAFFSSSEGL